mgnify:CR=1 FL=1
MSYSLTMFRTRQLILLLGDTFAFVSAFLIMALVRFDEGLLTENAHLQAKLFATVFVVWLVVFFVFDLYTYTRINPTPRTIGLIIGAMITNISLSVLIFYLFPTQGITPKTNLAIVAVISLTLVVVWRRSFYQLFSQTFTRRIGIIGASESAHSLKDLISDHPHIGTISFHSQELGEHQGADLIIAENMSADTFLALSRSLGTERMSVIQAYQTLFGKVPLSLMTDEHALSIITKERSGLFIFTRIVEILVGLLVLIITSPVLLIAIIARFIEDGRPIFIRQTRVGKDGNIFKLYKLRSMKALNTDGSAEIGGVQWAEKNDPRITPLGRILRKTHIDEIPQMYNIIRGDLALIGPRPERPEIVADLESQIPYYYLRHTVRPGFTGWAQIKFRYARTVLDSQEKFEYDLYYLMNRHPVLDVGIFIKTIQIIFTH